jgi:hypothetical protein
MLDHGAKIISRLYQGLNELFPVNFLPADKQFAAIAENAFGKYAPQEGFR